jgi:hypothetical protein
MNRLDDTFRPLLFAAFQPDITSGCGHFSAFEQVDE